METTVQNIDDVLWLDTKRRQRLINCDPPFDVVATHGDPLTQLDRLVLPLLSRLPRRTQAEEPWLEAVRSLAGDASEQDWTVITSIESIGWEYCAWCMGKANNRQLIVLPPGSTARFAGKIGRTINDLDLNTNRSTFIMPVGARKLSKSCRLHLRDQIMFQLADTHLPIVVRKSGYWEKALQVSDRTNRHYESQYPRKVKDAWRDNLYKFDAAISSDMDDMLVHWTRGIYDPWPGERHADYFEALTSVGTGNPRDGLSTLRFIAESGILRGHGKMIKGGTPAISFTPFRPGELSNRIKWRSTLGRWTFEPYGLALSRKTLEKLDARAVIYCDRTQYDELSEEDKPYYQFRGTGGKQNDINWQTETEWRLLGDLDIMSLKNEVILIVPTVEEALKLRDTGGYKIVALEKESIAAAR